MHDKNSSPRGSAGSVFIMALQGVEILYLPGSNEIVTRVQSKSSAERTQGSQTTIPNRNGKEPRGV